ncbi:COBRA-like protein 6 [Rutidosis leptorrhynchoides]|uniref:COBRA-like protein 6 n=1 Tax=Rutidosis leptorrhynchoides TaxID=125765 RepID=UPI003A9A13D1
MSLSGYSRQIVIFSGVLIVYFDSDFSDEDKDDPLVSLIDMGYSPEDAEAAISRCDVGKDLDLKLDEVASKVIPYVFVLELQFCYSMGFAYRFRFLWLLQNLFDLLSQTINLYFSFEILGKVYGLELLWKGVKPRAEVDGGITPNNAYKEVKVIYRTRELEEQQSRRFIHNYVYNADGYDALDPNGNITIKWDLKQENDAGTQDIVVSIFNHQLYRHVESPGWKLSWKWRGKEVIWDMRGAEATEQGNCFEYLGRPHLPHCCEREPVIVDLLPGTPYNMQVQNCCKAGVLSSITQDPDKSMASFQMNIDSLGMMPYDFDIGLPGYTCGNATKVPATKYVFDNGRRKTQALGTWNVTCTYSPFLASSAPKCCVSLSSFYSKTIVPCPTCSCGCQGEPGSNCIRHGQASPVLQLPHDEQTRSIVQCSSHMCPIRVHWHVKISYKEYWRVKITINNLNVIKNYSEWNLVVLHPNLQSLTQVFSFYYKPLSQYGSINDSGVFYGIYHYNDMLLHSGNGGNVQSEMLLHKDPGTFTFREGWVFPRRVIFNGDECVMPQPHEYPTLPNCGRFIRTSTLSYAILLPSLALIL